MGRASSTPRRYHVRVIAIFLALIAFSIARAQPAGADVLTSEGPVSGTTVDGMRAFLGIPYAKPPLGALRWQPPQRPIPRPGPYAATHFGNHCPQVPSPFGQPSLTEDCLYLNIFTPPHLWARANLPVMVWIHGGALTVGESDDYNPDRLVSRGVVVVTLNYRLGYLGFLANPALDAEHHPAVNYGFLDQQAALRWVRRNIAGFGGDPRRTTIFGESAGGLSVFSQLASPGGAGLFQRAIVESGGYQLTLPSLAASEAQGTALATALGCSGPATAACLRAVPVASILAQEGSLTTPAVDGTILPQSPGTAFATGQFNRVPVIDGSNHDEYRLFTAIDFDLAGGPLTAAAYPAVVTAAVGAAAAPSVLAEYPLSNYSSPDLAYAALGTDLVFSCNALAANLALSRYVPTWAYEFADENAPELYLPPVSFPYAAAHASELQFLFDAFHPPTQPLDGKEKALAGAMVGYWTTFAATGRPSWQWWPRPGWPAFRPSDNDILSLVPPRPEPDTTFAAFHNCSFWGSLASQASLQSLRTAAKSRFR